MGAKAAEETLEERNEVLLVGRISGSPVRRVLPSGDEIVSFRVVVRRREQAGETREVRTPRVETLDCTAWRPGTRRTAAALSDGDTVEVAGALRRRFWRTAGGRVSRCEVEVSRVRRMRRTATREH